MKFKEFIALIGICLTLTSCGIKGNLDLPESESEQLDASY